MRASELFFPSFQPFAFQTQRLLAECPGGGGEVTEVSWAASRIKEADFESWQSGWRWLAEHARSRAEREMSEGKTVTARERLLRAANYYRSSEFFLRPDNPAKRQTWDAMVECFRRASALWVPPFEWFDVPIEGGLTVPGYLVRPVGAPSDAPTVIYLNGADGTKEESWYLAGWAFVARGVNFVTIDGPGQGQPLRVQEAYGRPDFEQAVSPVVDYLGDLGIDLGRLGLVGVSLGGYYAGRVAAYESRFSCVALHGACYNVLEDLYMRYEPIRPQLQWVTGTFDDEKAKEALGEFDLAGHLHRIQVPVYICHGTEDALVDPEAARKTYEELAVDDKTLRWWGPEEGGSLHCNVDNPTESYPELIDWVTQRLGN